MASGQKIAELEQLVMSLQRQIAMERETHSAALLECNTTISKARAAYKELRDEKHAPIGAEGEVVAELRAALTYANARVAKLKADWEEALKWQGHWKRKAQRMDRGVDQPHGKSDKRSLTERLAAQEQVSRQRSLA